MGSVAAEPWSIGWGVSIQKKRRRWLKVVWAPSTDPEHPEFFLVSGPKEPLDLAVFRGGKVRILCHPLPGPELRFPENSFVPGKIGKAQDWVSAMLLGTEEIPLTPDLEVGPGDLEAVLGGPKTLEALHGNIASLGHENAVALVRPPPHTPPELV